MRLLRSFLLRIALILSTTAAICLFMMAATLWMQGDREGMVFTVVLSGIALVWVLLNWLVVRAVDPELSFEVARLLLPSGIVLSLILSWLMALVLSEMLPEGQGIEHFLLVFVGIGVAVFLGVRCFDIKWLRAEEEVAAYELRERQARQQGR